MAYFCGLVALWHPSLVSCSRCLLRMALFQELLPRVDEKRSDKNDNLKDSHRIHLLGILYLSCLLDSLQGLSSQGCLYPYLIRTGGSALHLIFLP